MASYSQLLRYQILLLFCTIFFSTLSLSVRVGDDRPESIRSKRWVSDEAIIEEPVTPPIGGGSHEDGTKTRRSIESRQDFNSSTEAPVDVGTTPNTTTTSTTTPTPTTTTTSVPTTLAPASVQQPMADISDFLAMNYSYTDQTSFENGTNDWDFTGTWSKTNLSDTEADKRPVPLPMKEMQATASSEPTADASADMSTDMSEDTSASATNSSNSTLPPDQNNFVMIYTVDEFSPRGFLRKSYGPTAYGEMFIRYYVAIPDTQFNVTLIQADNTMLQLFNSGEVQDSAVVEAWTARRFQFSELQTLNKEYMLVFSVAAPEGTEMGKPVLAVQHIAVGGMWPGGTPPIPMRPSNETVIPPGSAPYLESIANSIYTALYVFLAFFLLLIIALIVVVVRGRLR